MLELDVLARARHGERGRVVMAAAATAAIWEPTARDWGAVMVMVMSVVGV